MHSASTARLAEVLEPGILFEYYKGEFDTLPEFSALEEPASRGVLNSISINPSTEIATFDRALQANRSSESGNFAVRFTAQLKIPYAGIWTFYINSNDGSALYISGKRVIGNDGMHYATEKEGKLHIRSPGFYPITILYFHRNGKLLEGVRQGPFLNFSYYFPGSGWIPYPPDYVAKQTVPAQSLYYNPYDETSMKILEAIDEEQRGDGSIDEGEGNGEREHYNEHDHVMLLENELRDMSVKVYVASSVFK